MEASRCKRRSKRGSRSSKLRRTNADETPNDGPSRVAIPYLSSSSPQSCPFVHLSQRKAAKTKPQKKSPTQTKTKIKPNPTHYIRQNKKRVQVSQICFCKQFFVHFNDSHIISLKYLHLPQYSGIDPLTMIWSLEIILCLIDGTARHNTTTKLGLRKK